MTAVDGYRLGRAGVSGVILCAREHLNSLDESSMQEVKAAIRSIPWLDDYYDIGEKYIRSRDGRIRYAFTGLRNNLEGVKSKARILRAWVDEGEEVPDAGWSILTPTVRSEDDSAEKWWQSEIWVTWNPGSENSATHQRFRANVADNMKITEINHNDNPWFPAVLEEERLNDLRYRPDTYSHVWEGEFYELTEAQIFKGHYEKMHFEPTSEWHGPYHGLDFGFGTDPTAATQSYIFEDDLYIRRDFSQAGLELDHTVSALTRAIPRIALHTVRADNARPESISYLRRHGMPAIVGCKKGRGSVEDGIEFIKSFKNIYIHPEATAIYEEFCKYRYKVDKKSGDILPIPVDAYNHGIDSLRYALEPLIRFKAQPMIRAL